MLPVVNGPRPFAHVNIHWPIEKKIRIEIWSNSSVMSANKEKIKYQKNFLANYETSKCPLINVFK